MKKYYFKHSRAGFTLIELLVGMTIFSVALTSIFLLLSSTMKSASISRNEIIVSNLLREQIELVRNVRDSNIAKWAGWDAVRIDNGSQKIPKFEEAFVIIENNFDHTETTFADDGIDKTPVQMQKIDGFDEAKKNDFSDEKLKEKFEKTQLCFDEQKRYVHCKDDTHKTNSGSIFASYTHISPMKYGDTQITETSLDDRTSQTQWFLIDARVIIRDGSYFREYDAKTAITDWHR